MALRHDNEERAIQPRGLRGFRRDGYDHVPGVVLVFRRGQYKGRMDL
jgi:hypothetical protein